MSWTKVIPTPEQEPSVLGPIQSWDPIIGDMIDISQRWNRIGYPITDNFKQFWGIVEDTRQGDRMYKLYREVRDLLPDLPVIVNRHGDSPGAPGRLEIFFDGDADDWRSVCFADPYDQKSYINKNGKRVLAQVWYTDTGGTMDIIEVDHLEPERIAAAVRYMYDKWAAKYVTTPAVEKCPVCGQPDNSGDCNHNPLTAAELEMLS